MVPRRFAAAGKKQQKAEGKRKKAEGGCASWYRRFGISIFEFVSDFALRISDFHPTNATWTKTVVVFTHGFPPRRGESSRAAPRGRKTGRAAPCSGRRWAICPARDASRRTGRP